MAERATRGHGLLEGFLARRRARMARRLLAAVPRSGSILDLGCGSHPLFLLGSGFHDRVGVDRVDGDDVGRADGATAPSGEGIRRVHHDFEHDPALPFPADRFDAVTMLAVFEHIDPPALRPLLADVRRVLRPGGRLVLTTPAAWTGPVLWALARLGLVSHEEIDEHKDAYDHARIRDVLIDAGFDPRRLAFGSFELGMNLWITAVA